MKFEAAAPGHTGIPASTNATIDLSSPAVPPQARSLDEQHQDYLSPVDIAFAFAVLRYSHGATGLTTYCHLRLPLLSLLRILDNFLRAVGSTWLTHHLCKQVRP